MSAKHFKFSVVVFLVVFFPTFLFAYLDSGYRYGGYSSRYCDFGYSGGYHGSYGSYRPYGYGYSYGGVYERPSSVSIYSYRRPGYSRQSYSYHYPGRHSTRANIIYRYGGPFVVPTPIPPIIVERRPPKPVVLASTPEYLTRSEFLIETVRSDATVDRRLAAQELAQFAGVTSVAALVSTLINDPDSEVRLAAVKSLEEIDSPLAYEPLWRSARIESDKKVRLAAQKAAERIKNQNNIHMETELSLPPVRHGQRELSQCLKEYRYGQAWIRNNAVKSMRNFKDTRSVAALIDALINDPDHKIRAEAAESLAEISDSLALPFLKEARTADNEKTVRKEADRAIENIQNTTQ